MWGKFSVSIEAVLVGFILGIFLILQVNAISHGNFAGQDYQRHCNQIRVAANDPIFALTMPLVKGNCTPSLYHVFGGVIYNLVGEAKAWEAIAYFNLIVNVIALILLYGLIQRLISSRILRISSFLLISFLPVTVITSLVIAADALMLLLFVSMILVLLKIYDLLKAGKPAMGWMFLESVILIGMFLVKYNYIVNLGAILLIGLVLWKTQSLQGRQLFPAALIIVIIPLLSFIFMYEAYIHKQTVFFRDQNVQRQAKVHMDYRSLLLLKSKDWQILDAPYFHEFKFQDGKKFRPVQENNYYSYPALLHLAIFTDVLNMYQPIRYASNDVEIEDEYYTRVRFPSNQHKMKLAVRLGMIFSLAIFIAVLWLIFISIQRVLNRKISEDISMMMVLTLSVFIFSGIVIALPQTTWTYVQGLWLPRYIMPEIIAFAVLLFVALERFLLEKKLGLHWLALLFVMAQSATHISFLWVSS